MGDRHNLIIMLGLSAVSECPKCRKYFDNNYDLYDVEMPNCNSKKGYWRLHNYCAYCEHEFYEEFQITSKRLPC